MIDLSIIADRLRSQGLARVQGVLEYSGLISAPPQLPAHFVIPFDIAADPNRMVGVHDQFVVEEFAVITVVAATAVRLDRPSDEMREQVTAVWDALIAWKPNESLSAIALAGGQLLSAGGREAVWRSRFRTSYHLRRQPT